MASPTHNHDAALPRTGLWLPSQESMVSFDAENEDEEEYEGACGQAPAKKRRLSAKQVEFLERSFEAESKLEPERKGQLAEELGLQPRQVAIWFQNRRARFKTKQLERDFSALRASFDALTADYHLLLQHNQALKLEVDSLKEKLVSDKEREKDELGIKSENEISDWLPENPPATKASSSNYEPKQEDASSASVKSDVVDSDESPHCTENNYFSTGPAYSCHVAAAELSDFSQDEADALPFLRNPPGTCCHLGFAVEDNPFNFWRF